MQGRELRQLRERAEATPECRDDSGRAEKRRRRQRPPVERLLAGAVLVGPRRRRRPTQQRAHPARAASRSPPLQRRGSRPTHTIRRSPERPGRAGGSPGPDHAEAGEDMPAGGGGPAPTGRSIISPEASAPPTASTSTPCCTRWFRFIRGTPVPTIVTSPRARPTPTRTTRPAASAPASRVIARPSGPFPPRPRGSGFIEAPDKAGFTEDAMASTLSAGGEGAVGAGLGKALAVHRGFRRRGGTHAVGAVAVRAGGCAPVAAGERQKMTIGEPGRNRGASLVTGRALANLLELVAPSAFTPLGRRVADEAADLPRPRAAVDARHVLPVKTLVGNSRPPMPCPWQGWPQPTSRCSPWGRDAMSV